MRPWCLPSPNLKYSIQPPPVTNKHLPVVRHLIVKRRHGDLLITETHPSRARATTQPRTDMASTVASKVLPTEGCPLFKLPPELRLRIYHYTHKHQLENVISIHEEDLSLSQSWASTPLVRLAATCRLIANETRDFVRSLPASQRVAHVEVSGASPSEGWSQANLRHLPCPIIDLRRVVVTYDFTKYRSAADFPAANSSARQHTLAVREAMYSMACYLINALRRLMKDEALNTATALEDFKLRITGLQRNGPEESQQEAVRRILDRAVGCTSAESLVHAIRRRDRVARDVEKDEPSPRLMVCKGRQLYLLL